MGKADRRGNLCAAKADAVVALLMSVGRAMAEGGAACDLGAVLGGQVFA